MLESLTNAGKEFTSPIPGQLFMLQNTWNQAYERLYSATTKDRVDLILNMTALKGVDYLNNYLQSHEHDLKPEEKHFIEMSVRLKIHPESAIASSNKMDNSARETISNEDFQNYVSENFISQDNLEIIARKIIENKMLSPKELAVYSGKSNEIEGLIKSKFNNN